MKNKKNFIIILVGITLIAILFIIIYLYGKGLKKSDIIPDGYISVFNGGSGEITYSTYIYKIDNGKANYGFKYINTTNTTTSWGSSEWNIKITGRGILDWTDDVFYVANENNAYSYVLLPNDKKAYTIEEYQKMFLMN